ncbi:glycosyltransferase family 4 protein [Azospirillum picis]|uniref:Glycosyltransferase involved in cell wall biosynthesis n=1 Tax=Azospirillum picis TaxID=488438 RepID=A0ABU0MDP1_9PROT|nr:glycosyltransferase family 4 protein [Azospirillum picis]MBP2297431.1 glycosyltransferase involved in cell wall biosynthesis [Azospirillum picis]MDQ0531546.1 glycosyltransferase involved in cell wall biosynthesis [Azospirillum picis]
MERNTRTHVVVSGRLPPPVDGMSRVTALVLDRLQDRMRGRGKVEVADLSPGWNGGGVRYHLRKLGRVLGAMGRLFGGLRAPDRRFYMPVDSGWGALYTATLAGTARMLGYERVLHHHSFATITKPTWRMRLLTRLAGTDCTHVLLCPAMQMRFQSVYPAARTCMTMSNAIFSAPDPAPRPRRAGPLRIGHLSNLCAEKGLDTLFALLRALQLDGVDAKLVLAGPGLRPKDDAMVAAGLMAFDGAVEYHGPVHGEAKAAFYRDIDVFVFPTRYRNEAQPLVLFEAMAAGVPVLAYDRGCIGSDIPSDGLVPQNTDFVKAAVPLLAAWADDREALAAASAETLARARIAYETGRTGLDLLLERIAGPHPAAAAAAPQAKRRVAG